MQRLVEALALRLRELELGEGVPERVDGGLVELHARLGHRVDRLAGDAHLVVGLAHLEVLEGLRERRLAARVVRLREELHEVHAREVVEAAARVLLRQRVDDGVEQGLHLGRAGVVARPRHVVLVELRQALDRVGALRRIVEALDPGRRVVLVLTCEESGREREPGERGRDAGRRRQHTKRAAERTHRLHGDSPLVPRSVTSSDAAARTKPAAWRRCGCIACRVTVATVQGRGSECQTHVALKARRLVCGHSRLHEGGDRLRRSAAACGQAAKF